MRTSSRGCMALFLILLPLVVACSTTTTSPTPVIQTPTVPVPTLVPTLDTLQGDVRVHDPSMIKQGSSYYVFSTGDEHGLNGGNIQIRSSVDRVRWALVGTVFPTTPAWIGETLGSTPPNLWAPDISYFNNTYHLYYAGSRFGSNSSVIGLATNTTLDPANPDYHWVDQGLVIQSTRADNWNAIDPNLVLDADGRPWLSFGSFWDGIKMRRIDLTSGKLAANDTKLYPLASRGGGPIEAPFIIYRDGLYYLFVSFDLCCRGANSTYKIMVGRSEHIIGPYVDSSGKQMLLGGGSLVLESRGRYVGPGGQSVLLDADTYWLIHHYYDAADNGIPKLQINDLTWTSDGWPRVAP